MRNHKLIWSIAIAALIGAFGLALYRQYGAPGAGAPSLNAVIEETLAALDADPQLENADTQALLRRAATRVEENKLSSAKGAYLLGKQYVREQNMPVAESLFRTACELEAAWSAPWYELGTLLAKHSFGRAEEAEVALRKAIELDPEWARPHNALAVLLRVHGRYKEAEVAAKRSLELGPDDVANHNNYANLLISLDRFEEAESHYQTALRLDPERPKPLYNLACLYALMGEQERAMEHLAKAVNMAPILREEAWIDPDLDSLRALPEFKLLIHGKS